MTSIGSFSYLGKEHRVGDGQEGPVTRRLREALCVIHAGTSDLHPEWIEKVPVFAGRRTAGAAIATKGPRPAGRGLLLARPHRSAMAPAAGRGSR